MLDWRANASCRLRYLSASTRTRCTALNHCQPALKHSACAQSPFIGARTFSMRSTTVCRRLNIQHALNHRSSALVFSMRSTTVRQRSYSACAQPPFVSARIQHALNHRSSAREHAGQIVVAVDQLAHEQRANISTVSTGGVYEVAVAIVEADQICHAAGGMQRDGAHHRPGIRLLRA